ncbi:hypothetical protein KXJ72_17865 (plasmid) [Comamonas aquatica]|nr:hypothetical protein KXJ72_17865 [Comamonas aquatica]
MRELRSHHIKFRRGHGLEIDGMDEIESKIISLMSSCMGKWRKNVKDGDIDLVVYESTAEFARWYSMLGAVAKKNGAENRKLSTLKKGLLSVERALTRIKGDLKGRLRLLTKKHKDEPEIGVVRLMTMHGSKGLEWNHVYLMGCEETERHASITDLSDVCSGMTRRSGKTMKEAQVTNIHRHTGHVGEADEDC